MGSSRIRTLGNALKSAMIGAVVVAGLPRGVAGDTAELTPSSGLTNSAAGFFETAKTMLECQVCKVRISITTTAWYSNFGHHRGSLYTSIVQLEWGVVVANQDGR